MKKYHLLIIVSYLLLPLTTTGQDAAFEDQAEHFLTILSPLPDSAISGDEPLEISLLLEGQAGIGYQILLDSLDITGDCQIAPDYIFYLSPYPWPPGEHRIKLLGFTNGDTLVIQTWRFNIAEPRLSISLLTDDRSIEILSGFLSLGIKYITCDRDTTGLGLAYPVGLHPAGDLSLTGPLLGGMVSGTLNYDPSYDRLPHGLMVFSGGPVEISLGEFLPEMSSLAFYQSLPLGFLGRWQDQKFLMDLTACRTVSSDTTIRIFNQYLYGGRCGMAFNSALSLGLGFLRGQDDPQSLPDSIRFQSTMAVYRDTIFDLTDTIITMDTIHPGKNNTLWLWGQYKWRFYSLSLEAARSLFSLDTGSNITGIGLLISWSMDGERWPFSISYRYTSNGFRSFGNPFLEAGRSQVESRVEWQKSPSLNLKTEGHIYRSRLDSTSAWGYGAVLGLNYHAHHHPSLGLRLEIRHSPYRGYNYDLQGLSSSLSGTIINIRATANYGFAQTVSSRISHIHNAGAELARTLWGRYLSGTLNYLYSTNINQDDGLRQVRHNLGVTFFGDISPHFSYNIQARVLKVDNYSSDISSYQQMLWQLNLGYRF